MTGRCNKKKKGKSGGRSKDPARLAAALLQLSRWASLPSGSRESDSLGSLPRLDLHTHSTCSDGLLSPADVVTRAHRNGVRVLALTDHDTMAGMPVALEVARVHGMRLIPGVEISAKFASSSQLLNGEEEPVHILAYYSCCGPARWRELEENLLQIRQGRYKRAQVMVQKLHALNKPVKLEQVLQIAGEGVAPGRAHVARALVAAGLVDTVEQAFSRYLHNCGPAYVPGAEQPAEDVVRLIHRTGGIAVLAHPWVLKHPFPLIERLKAAGLHAMEVYRRDGKDTACAAWADAFNLAKVGGSDYHGRGSPEETDLGGVTIPAMVMLQFLTVAQPIWQSAIRLIIQDFAEDVFGASISSACENGNWKGDMFVREEDGESYLILSPWLTEEEKLLVQDKATELGLRHMMVSKRGVESIAVMKRLRDY